MSISENIIRNIEYFPVQPGSGYDLIGKLEEPGISKAELYKILEFDIPSTANILKLCSSSANTRSPHMSGKITSLKEAFDQLELEELKRMIRMSASTDIFSPQQRYRVRT